MPGLTQHLSLDKIAGRIVCTLKFEKPKKKLKRKGNSVMGRGNSICKNLEKEESSVCPCNESGSV